MNGRLRGPLAVAVLLAAGVLVAAATSWMRTHRQTSEDPLACLPSSGLIVSFGAKDLRARLAELRGFPIFRGLKDLEGGDAEGRPLSGGLGAPHPSEEVPATGPAAIGFYRAGWAIVRPSDSDGPPRLPHRTEGAFSVIASVDSILESGGFPASCAARAPADGVLVRAEIENWLRFRSRSASLLAGHVPRAALGRLRLSGRGLHEEWKLECAERCGLEILDTVPSRSCDAEGWTAIPPDAAAVEWFRLSPARLAAWGSEVEAGSAGNLISKIRRIERFLGIPLLTEIGGAISGPCIAATRSARSGEKPDSILVIDLRAPDRARAVLDRVVALAVLGGSMAEESYRGVPIASWTRRSGPGGLEPAAAVDGNLLILGLDRTNVADAIDRRRAPGALTNASEIRSRLETLPPGSWKAESRSPSLVESWEEILGVAPAPLPSVVETRAVLARSRDGWTLRGDGTVPACSADQIVPVSRRLLRAIRPARTPR